MWEILRICLKGGEIAAGVTGKAVNIAGPGGVTPSSARGLGCFDFRLDYCASHPETRACSDPGCGFLKHKEFPTGEPQITGR